MLLAQPDGGTNAHRVLVVGHDGCKELVEVVHCWDDLGEAGCTTREDEDGVLQNL